MNLPEKIARGLGVVMVPEVSDIHKLGFRMFNDAGTEVEVGAFLHAFVRMTKPEVVLETGTNAGVSAAFIAHALMMNGRGHLNTIEFNHGLADTAEALLHSLSLRERATVHRIDIRLKLTELALSLPGKIDFAFLDSEPQLRFAELTTLLPFMNPGSFFVVHDLHPSFGFPGREAEGMTHWPYGDFRESVGPFIKDRTLQVITFPTPRGLSMLQKRAPTFNFTNFIFGNI